MDKVVEAAENFERIHEESTGQERVSFPLATLVDPFIRTQLIPYAKKQPNGKEVLKRDLEDDLFEDRLESKEGPSWRRLINKWLSKY